MTTNTAGTAARQLSFQAVHYFRKGITYATTGIGTAATVEVGTLPSGAVVLFTLVQVTEAFNDGSNDDAIDVGTSSNNDAYVDSTNNDCDPETVGGYTVFRGTDVTHSADTVVYVTYTGTSGDATTGAAEIIMAYVVDNDS